MPAPSPRTKPSRSRSQGRDAVAGSSLRVESARIAAKPPTASGVTTASEPPAIITSASPRRMMFAASPIACADVAQAVATAEFGPLAPVRIEIEARADMLTMRPGMKNGLMRRGPFSRTVLCISSMSGRPPIPAPMQTPTLSAFSVVDDDARVGHRLLRRRDGEVDERVELLDVLLFEECARIEALHLAGDPARVVRRVEAGDRPDARAPREEGCPRSRGAVRPTGETRPTPVTATRRRPRPSRSGGVIGARRLRPASPCLRCRRRRP